MEVRMGDSPEVEEPAVKEETEEAPKAEAEETEEDDSGLGQVTSLEDLPPDEELWPEGPTAAQVIGWKDEYGEVFVSSFPGENNHVIWRTMNRFEYKRMIKAMEQASATGQMSEADVRMFNEEYMSELCVLYPKFSRADLVGTLAGLPSIISQEVMEASGFVALEVRQL